jgi:hypothetical protein
MIQTLRIKACNRQLDINATAASLKKLSIQYLY